MFQRKTKLLINQLLISTRRIDFWKSREKYEIRERLTEHVRKEFFLPRWCVCRSWWGRRWVSWGAPSLDREICGVSWPAWRECPRGSPAGPRRQPRHPWHRHHRIPRRAWAPRPLGARKGAHRRSPSSRSLKASRDKRINARRVT